MFFALLKKLLAVIMCNLTSFSALKENKATIKNFWKVLSKVDLSDNDCAILFPNDYLFVSSEETKYLCGLYTGSSTRTAISGTNFVQVLQSGYVLASINEGEVGLFSPCGNLMKVFVYDKKQFSRVRLVKKEGVNHYISGYSFINKFFLRYNTLAARCANRCYLAKANGFDFNKLFYVGEYEEISEMKDSACGMVYVLYKDGTFKLFDKKLLFPIDFREVLCYNILLNKIYAVCRDFGRRERQTKWHLLTQKKCLRRLTRAATLSALSTSTIWR